VRGLGGQPSSRRHEPGTDRNSESGGVQGYPSRRNESGAGGNSKGGRGHRAWICATFIGHLMASTGGRHRRGPPSRQLTSNRRPITRLVRFRQESFGSGRRLGAWAECNQCDCEAIYARTADAVPGSPNAARPPCDLRRVCISGTLQSINESSGESHPANRSKRVVSVRCGTLIGL
jgi:hypothetical protein